MRSTKTLAKNKVILSWPNRDVLVFLTGIAERRFTRPVKYGREIIEVCRHTLKAFHISENAVQQSG